MDPQPSQSNGFHPSLEQIPLSYSHTSSEESALRLVYAIRPKWRDDDGPVDIIRFTDGITNTLLQLIKRRKDWSEEEQENESILMRAYGNDTEILIDRDREALSHGLCAQRGLAPPLLARFSNGLLYKFIRGRPSKPEDLTKESVWRGVAQGLGDWHARLPISAVESKGAAPKGDNAHQTNGVYTNGAHHSTISDRRPVPNVWTVMQKWIAALPSSTDADRERQESLQKELERAFTDLDSKSGLGESGFVFAHCDLLSGNVIILPPSEKHDGISKISFIDYEYATPAPAAFDIANHFAEWGGFDCDYNMLPTKAVREAFLKEYLQSYHHNLPSTSSEKSNFNLDQQLNDLAQEVDRYRGMPGFYWGIWALIQAKISQIDFDYASYAETRLGEYWAWRDSEKGQVKTPPLRERRWTQDE